MSTPTIKDLGGPAAVARMTGVKVPSVIGWKDRIPADRRPAIERAKYPDVCVEHLGDDVRWQRVPDAEWPHPAGRPCIDVVAMQAQSRAVVPDPSLIVKPRHDAPAPTAA